MSRAMRSSASSPTLRAMRGHAPQRADQLVVIERLDAAVALGDLERRRACLLVGRESALARGARAAPAQAIGRDPSLGHARVAAAIRALHALILLRGSLTAKFRHQARRAAGVGHPVKRIAAHRDDLRESDADTGRPSLDLRASRSRAQPLDAIDLVEAEARLSPIHSASWSSSAQSAIAPRPSRRRSARFVILAPDEAACRPRSGQYMMPSALACHDDVPMHGRRRAWRDPSARSARPS